MIPLFYKSPEIYKKTENWTKVHLHNVSSENGKLLHFERLFMQQQLPDHWKYNISKKL